MIKRGINNLVTHNGSFHADDIFACATLQILLDGRIRVARTRDEKIINDADVVFDVGGVYDPDTDRFDHHQQGGAGKRENGIEYASFGLVWKKYGEQICGSKEVADEIDRKLATPIDAKDNGIDIIVPKFKDVFPYTVGRALLAGHPTWKEIDVNIDEIFMKQVEKAVEILTREIQVAKDDVEGKKIIMQGYMNAQDKRIVVLETSFPRYLFQDVLSRFPEPIYLVYPGIFGKNWKIEAISKNPSTMRSRKMFPLTWRLGVNNDPKLKQLTGVPDVLFAHRGGFLVTASSKEGALQLATKALKSGWLNNLWHLLMK